MVFLWVNRFVRNVRNGLTKWLPFKSYNESSNEHCDDADDGVQTKTEGGEGEREHEKKVQHEC